MFATGLVLLAIAAVGAFFSVAPPADAARPGAIGVALGCGIAGALLVYLDAPRRRAKLPAGMVRAEATILDATATAGEVAGYRMIELTLEVEAENGPPFQVKRKFSAGRLGRVEQGRRIDVVYDPVEPKRVELG